MGLICNSCGAEVPSNDINIEKDIAKCSDCGAVFSASEALSDGRGSGTFDPHDCPRGVSFEERPNGFVLSATTRTPMGFVYLPFAVLWILGSLSITFLPVSAESAAAGVQSMGFVHMAIGIPLLYFALLMTVGRLQVIADGYEGSVFLGVGPIGWRKRFSWKDFETIRTAGYRFLYSFRERNQVVLEGRRRVAFGALLSDERFYHVRKTIEVMLKRLHR